MPRARKKPLQAATAAVTEQGKALRARAIAMTLDGCSQVAIAEALHVDRSTVSAWMGEVEVRAELEAAKARVIDEAHDRLVALLGKAVETHAALLMSEDDGTAMRAVQLAYDRVGMRFQAQVAAKVEHSGSVQAVAGPGAEALLERLERARDMLREGLDAERKRLGKGGSE